MNRFCNFPFCISLVINFFLIFSYYDISFQASYVEGMFFINKFVIFFKAFIILGGIFALLLSIGNSKFEKSRFFEYPIIVLLSIEAMLLLVSSNNLFVVYLALELQGLA